jgi:hypothetical protein
MRSILLSVLIMPVFASAQINRSAKELAGETIGKYITTILFKNQSYHPVSFGELRPRQEENSEVIWSYDHKFEIAENKIDPDKKQPVIKTYKFIFYLDKRMKVKRADGSFID